MTTHSTFAPSSAARWLQCPAAAELAAIDRELLDNRAQWLNWRAYLVAVDTHAAFTPYHAASKARCTLRFSQEHKS